jgi:hypothetical protein
MTITEMHTAVKIGLDKTSSLSLPAFEPEEIDFWLNKAQEKFVDQIYEDYKHTGLESKLSDYLAPLLESFSQSDYITKPINKDDTSTSFSSHALRYNIRFNRISNPLTPTVFLDYTTDIRYILSVYVLANRIGYILEEGTTGTAGIHKCKEIKESEVNQYITTDMNIPYFEDPVYYVTQDYGYSNSLSLPLGVSMVDEKYKEFVIIYDSFSNQPLKIYANILRNPVQVVSTLGSTVNCELPISTHNKIVDTAVLMMIENIESSRLQTNAQILSL